MLIAHVGLMQCTIRPHSSGVLSVKRFGADLLHLRITIRSASLLRSRHASALRSVFTEVSRSSRCKPSTGRCLIYTPYKYRYSYAEAWFMDRMIEKLEVGKLQADLPDNRLRSTGGEFAH